MEIEQVWLWKMIHSWKMESLIPTGILELIVFIEETFKIEIPENELNPENLDSLNNISAYILSKKENFNCDQSSLQASEPVLP